MFKEPLPLPYKIKYKRIVMEMEVASFEEYEIFMADKSCSNEVANFIVRENYSHHMSSFTEDEITNL